jgi:hypothetical protein
MRADATRDVLPRSALLNMLMMGLSAIWFGQDASPEEIIGAPLAGNLYGSRNRLD